MPTAPPQNGSPAASPAGSLGSSGVQKTAAGIPEVFFVPSVIGQFVSLPERADALGFGIGNSRDPRACKHYQGIVRSHGAGTPYFFVSKSGNKTPSCSSEDDEPGILLVVRMGSRDETGERLRSNRLERGKDTDDTPPPTTDTTVEFIVFNGTQGVGGSVWPNYGHPGGMQLVGDVLVVPLEKPYGVDLLTEILFIDVSNPGVPTLLSSFDPLGRFTCTPLFEFSIGLVAVTPLANGRYLMLASGGDNEMILVFESLPTELDGTTNLKSPDLVWTCLDRWIEEHDEDDLGRGFDWPTNPFGGSFLVNHPHQTLNFVREGDIDGDLYLIGIRNKGGGGGGAGLDEDKLDLFKVEWEGSEFKLRWIVTKDVVAKSTSDGDDLANLAAASGVYVSPTGELIVYACEHDNDGPEGDHGRGTVKAAEWRHQSMVRPGSPTYNPTVRSGGPYEVLEGGTVRLSGDGAPPIARPWIELFADPDFEGRSVVIDYSDWSKDDFDDFKDLEDGPIGEGLDGFSDEASSWRWFAPEECTLRFNDDDFGDSSFPGPDTKTIVSLGSVGTARNLEDVQNDSRDHDMDDVLTSAQFFPDCADYYSAEMVVSWDLDLDGSFETVGERPFFLAEEFDGPSTIEVPVRATHPTDGRRGSGAATIDVQNVAPTLVSLGTTAVTENGTTTLTGTIVEPGSADTLRLVIDWGDSVSPGNSQTIDLVAGTTTISLSHRYLDDNPTGSSTDMYSIALGITDDDGGTTSTSKSVRVENAAPVVVFDPLRDETGLEIGVTQPVALVGLELALSGSFTDVGTLDVHTATIDWGDAGMDALGAVTASLVGRHAFGAPGLFSVSLGVVDDDTGRDVEVREVRVVDARDGAGTAAEVLAGVAANPGASQAISKAISDLVGNNGGRAANGAVDKFDQGNLNAALVKLRQAVGYLVQAERVDPGIDLTPQKNLLALSAKSTVIGEMREEESGPDPDQGALAAARAAVAGGDSLLAGGDQEQAIESYRRGLQLVGG